MSRSCRVRLSSFSQRSRRNDRATIGRRLMRIAILWTILCWVAPLAIAAEEPQVSSFSLTFTQKSPSSDPVKITQRAGWALEKLKAQMEIDYDPSAESDQV